MNTIISQQHQNLKVMKYIKCFVCSLILLLILFISKRGYSQNDSITLRECQMKDNAFYEALCAMMLSDSMCNLDSNAYILSLSCSDAPQFAESNPIYPEYAIVLYPIYKYMIEDYTGYFNINNSRCLIHSSVSAELFDFNEQVMQIKRNKKQKEPTIPYIEDYPMLFFQYIDNKITVTFRFDS